MEYSNCCNVLHEAFLNFCNKTENGRNLYDVYKSMFPYLKNINICFKNINLTPEQYIQLRSVEIEKEIVDMVRNKRNVSINMLMGNGAQPFYNIK